MNGSEILVKTAVKAGVKVCFANPGTTELPLIEALDAVPGIRAVLCLFEGVCTGAADGYGRMADKPAMTILHLGPGLGNGIANLHNARRAGTPVLNIIGEHATWHLSSDAPLTMDIEKLSKTVSGWQRTIRSTSSVSNDTIASVEAALKGQVATMIFPHDLQLSPYQGLVADLNNKKETQIDEETVKNAAEQLKKNSKTAILLGGQALGKEAIFTAAGIKNATGCDLYSETFPSRMERGRGIPFLQRLPYFPEQAISILSKYQTIILAGAREPVGFFGWPNSPGKFINDKQKIIHLSENSATIKKSLTHLAKELDINTVTTNNKPQDTKQNLPEIPHGQLTGEKACIVLSLLQPENTILVDESITSGALYYSISQTARRHTLLSLTGGAIGMGIPLSVGAAMACPDRPVINLQADGSAMYTIQGLWTQARESLNITTLICSNRSYDILKYEMARAGWTSPGKIASQMTGLDQPPLNWVSISKGMGVPAVSVDTPRDLAEALKRSLSEPGPHLIEMKL